MRASVLQNFTKFNTPFEGMLNYMYTDVKGLVTTGMGNLIDPLPAALVLPWKHADGSDASQDEITQEWNTVKGAWPGVQSTGDRAITTLHLDQADIDVLIASKAQQFEDTLRGIYPDYDNWPADAQLGVLSMSWALGAGFGRGFPQFTAAANAYDFRTAAAQSGYRDQDPGNKARQAANVILFNNAATVVEGNGDREVLYYPSVLQPGQAVQTGSSGMAKTLLVLGGVGAAIAGAAFYVTRGRRRR